MQKQLSVSETGSWNHRGATRIQHSSSNFSNPTAGVTPRRGESSANSSKRLEMNQVVPKLTRGTGVEFQQGKHTIEATVLKTVTGYGYSVLTDTGNRRLIPSNQIFFKRS
jgi:hypothetical protein